MKTRVMLFRPTGGDPGGDPPAPPAPAAPPAAGDPPAPVAVADPPAPADPAAPPAADPAAPPADPAAAADPKETVYDLKLPEKSGLHASIIKRTAATARELGLSPDAAQKVLDFTLQEATKHAEKATTAAVEEALKAHQPGGAEWEKQQTAWKADALADPVLGKDEQERRAVIDKGKAVLKRYTEMRPDHAELFKDVLEETGIGSHKAVLGFFGWLGQTMGEGKIVNGDSGAGKQKSVAEIFYPKGANRTEEQVATGGQ